MNNEKEELLNQVNIDIIFFFLSLVSSFVSFYLINEKKKSILKRNTTDKETADTIYYYNRRLNVIICIYFFVNAYNSYQNATNYEDKKQEGLLLIATFLALISSLLYLPLGNSNIIIDT